MLATLASQAAARLLLLASGLLLSAHGTAAAQAYQIQDTYDASNFFDGFEFFSGPDPTEGFVRYQTAVEANASALAGYANGGVFLGVDYKNKAGGGRASTRVNTKKKYTRGLFVADIAHMPSSTCGVWAAFWSFGDPWPSAGEIDIIEGVNRDTSTKFTLHTAGGCSFFTNDQAGDCNAPGDGTKGCTAPGFNDPRSYGDGFNAIGGGVYATEWTSEAIRIWFFPRTTAAPADLHSASPDPSTWGPPSAQFSGGAGGGASCDIDSHFREHRLVFNTALCGQWAGRIFGQDPQCAGLAPSCEEYVANNPGAFASAYWLINSVKVYSREIAPDQQQQQQQQLSVGAGISAQQGETVVGAGVQAGAVPADYAVSTAPAAVAPGPAVVVVPGPSSPAVAAVVQVDPAVGYGTHTAPAAVIGKRQKKQDRTRRRLRRQRQEDGQEGVWPHPTLVPA
ncbi:family 16 glycosylhydrolase [Microdochium nivale]|nr:family 16 glycosylhydrolase [Microdochium nivale]